MRSESFWELVGDTKKSLLEPSLSSRISDVRRALLLLLRAAEVPFAYDVRDVRALPRAAGEFLPSGPIDGLTRQLALFGEQLCGQRDTLFKIVYAGLKPYLPDSFEFDAFKALSVFEETLVHGEIIPAATTKCQVFHKGSSLAFGIGTVAGMKGETHVASLILESYGGNSRKFDVELGLAYIAGLAPKKLEKLPKTQQAQMRNLYVAMSRPTTLLCLAANQSRAPQNLRDALASKGWHLEIVT